MDSECSGLQEIFGSDQWACESLPDLTILQSYNPCDTIDVFGDLEVGLARGCEIVRL